MPLEATILLLDNSEWMRNGDYTPSRWEAQSDAVNVVFNAKTNSNPENEVGLMTMAGKSPEVLVTLTKDLGKVLTALHSSKLSGSSNLSSGINIAQLALKHRENKNQRQRIIAFVGSPVADAEDDLVRLGKRLKKNNVAIDVVNFGEDEQNEAKLRSFVSSVDSADNSHLVTIPAGPQLLSDSILSSSMLAADIGGHGSTSAEADQAGAGGNAFEFGVDPSMDPELAMALRMSLEEEQARQRAAGASSESAQNIESASHAPSASATLPSATNALGPISAAAQKGSLVPAGAVSTTGEDTNGDETEDEEAMLARALALSTAGQAEEPVAADDQVGRTDDSTSGKRSPESTQGQDEDADMDEDEAIARAIEMSLRKQG